MDEAAPGLDDRSLYPFQLLLELVRNSGPDIFSRRHAVPPAFFIFIKWKPSLGRVLEGTPGFQGPQYIAGDDRRPDHCPGVSLHLISGVQGLFGTFDEFFG